LDSATFAWFAALLLLLEPLSPLDPQQSQHKSCQLAIQTTRAVEELQKRSDEEMQCSCVLIHEE